MNAIDREMMVRDYDKAREESERTFEHSIIKLQDAAYAMGYERGSGHHNRMTKALEEAAEKLNELGHEAMALDIDRLLDEVTT